MSPACGPVLVRGPKGEKGDKGDPGPPADLSGESAWADPARDAELLLYNKTTGSESVMQSFAVDSINRHIYTVQVIPDGVQLDDETAPLSYSERDAAGDLVFTRLTLDEGDVLDRMYVRGLGHGNQIGVDSRSGTAPRIWTGTDVTTDEDGHDATTVGWFTWAPSDTAALDSADLTRFMPTGQIESGSYVNVDPLTRRLVCSRYLGDFDWQFTLYPLDDAYQDVWQPLASVTANLPHISLAGFAAADNYLYVWTGYSLNEAPENNTTIRRYDVTTGRLADTVLVDDLMNGEVARREPEGLAVWMPDATNPNTWTLSAGFACTLSGHYVQTVIGWPVPALTVGNPVTEGWTDLPLADAFTAYSADNRPQYTVLAGGIAQLRGMVKYADGTSVFGDADTSGYTRICTDLPDVLLAEGVNPWQRPTIAADGYRSYVLEIDGRNGLMNVAWPVGGGGARWADLTATFAVRRT